METGYPHQVKKIDSQVESCVDKAVEDFLNNRPIDAEGLRALASMISVMTVFHLYHDEEEIMEQIRRNLPSSRFYAPSFR